MENEVWLPTVPDPRSVDLPLNAKLVLEHVRRSISSGRALRIMEDAYFITAETDLAGFLNEDEVKPYAAQVYAFLEGDSVPPAEAVTRRVMACHRTIGDVYVVRAPSTGFYKIGFTTNLRNRSRQISRKCGQVAVVLTLRGNKATESLLHSLFQAKRANIGKEIEWFKLDEDDLQWIRDIKRSQWASA